MFFIDTLSEIPIYTQICNGIIKEIAEGNLKNGDSLPSVRQFAKDFNVNPMTVNKAYGILKNENIIEIDRRNGSVICVKCEKKHLKKIEDNLENIINEVKARGLSKEDLFNIIERSFQC
ncbi:MAG: GntR family transcriptional regulator [Peptoniphilaceae bacterium]|uniref:GntR family transcriptional regulator n=1 Tax=Parvimonas sp. TaxID=1944660 RepID=UPI0025E81928|nr:GntR family transcriptional regulator [Parvimonas sp.]MCI5996832.1 GntR family transcriptional regulator [Parvimonas sp.]MDD7764162.1 GntR family transcriptional regulator [Peptoniphilaceae bacterium]MDY3050799.1 GntR family transcriptional regulator [Parvimonas sp.]